MSARTTGRKLTAPVLIQLLPTELFLSVQHIRMPPKSMEISSAFVTMATLYQTVIAWMLMSVMMVLINARLMELVQIRLVVTLVPVMLVLLPQGFVFLPSKLAVLLQVLE